VTKDLEKLGIPREDILSRIPTIKFGDE